jgi:hypothetical protein
MTVSAMATRMQGNALFKTFPLTVWSRFQQ